MEAKEILLENPDEPVEQEEEIKQEDAQETNDNS